MQATLTPRLSAPARVTTAPVRSCLPVNGRYWPVLPVNALARLRILSCASQILDSRAGVRPRSDPFVTSGSSLPVVQAGP